MYGTIARFTLKPGTAKEFGEVARAQDGAPIPGYVGSTVYHSDTNPDECWLVVTFEDKESYKKNPDDPAQNERYLELAKFSPKTPNGTTARLSTAPAQPRPLRHSCGQTHRCSLFDSEGAADSCSSMFTIHT